MDITITGKQFHVTESLKEYVRKKTGKLKKYFNQLIDAHVVLTVEKLDHFVEVTINGDSVVFHAEVRTEDMYASIDSLFEKMEKQIRRHKEKHSGHKVKPLKHIQNPSETGEPQGVAIMVSEAENKPMLNPEAVSQLHLNNYRFLLFKKGLETVETPEEFTKHEYAICCSRKDGNYSIVELINGSTHLHIYETAKENKIPAKLNKLESRDFLLNKFSYEDAAMTIKRLNADYYIFQNVDDNQLNIIYQLPDGELAVKVPPE